MYLWQPRIGRNQAVRKGKGQAPSKRSDDSMTKHSTSSLRSQALVWTNLLVTQIMYQTSLLVRSQVLGTKLCASTHCKICESRV